MLLTEHSYLPQSYYIQRKVTANLFFFFLKTQQPYSEFEKYKFKSSIFLLP